MALGCFRFKDEIATNLKRRVRPAKSGRPRNQANVSQKQKSLHCSTLAEVTLRCSALGLAEMVRQARLSAGEHLLAVVDQFEELFRFNLETAVGRHSGCVPGGAWQGTTRRNSQLLQRVVTQPGAVRRVHWVT